MASIRNSPGGPLIKVKVRPLEVKFGNCYRVLMRRMKPGFRHGQWEPVSVDGFVVVCPSYLEASELCYMLGHRYFPIPLQYAESDAENADELYLNWLLTHYLRIEPYQAGQPFEVRFAEFIKGWRATAEDIPLNGRSATVAAVKQVLDSRWSAR